MTMEDKIKKSSLSIDEMSQLEALDIKGGQNDVTTFQTPQYGCPNNVRGCACSNVADRAQK